MKSLKEDGFTEIMEMFRLSDIEEPIPKREKKEESTPLNKKLKVGDYYINERLRSGEVRRIYETDDRTYKYQPINTDIIRTGDWNYFSEPSLRKLTYREIKESLIQEAKNRGYEKGIISRSLLDKEPFKALKGILEAHDSGKERGITVSLDGKWIYLNGKWAVIE